MPVFKAGLNTISISIFKNNVGSSWQDFSARSKPVKNWPQQKMIQKRRQNKKILFEKFEKKNLKKLFIKYLFSWSFRANFGQLAALSETGKLYLFRLHWTYIFKPGTICDDDSIDLVALPVVDHARHLPAVLRAEVHPAGPPAIQPQSTQSSNGCFLA